MSPPTKRCAKIPTPKMPEPIIHWKTDESYVLVPNIATPTTAARQPWADMGGPVSVHTLTRMYVVGVGGRVARVHGPHATRPLLAQRHPEV
eukprot:4031645-Prymnesium_polylepis.2